MRKHPSLSSLPQGASPYPLAGVFEVLSQVLVGPSCKCGTTLDIAPGSVFRV